MRLQEVQDIKCHHFEHEYSSSLYMLTVLSLTLKLVDLSIYRKYA